MVEQLPLLVLFVILLSFYLAVRAARIKMEEKNPSTFEVTFFKIRVPKGNTKQSLSAEQMFASLHGLLREKDSIQEHISFEIESSENGINFYVVAPNVVKEFVLGQIYAQYPDAEIKEEKDYAQLASAEGVAISGARITQAKDYYFPIRTFRDFDVDPLAAITGSFAEMSRGGRVWWQIIARPLPDKWQEAGHEYVAVQRGEKKPAVKLSLKILMEEVRKEIVVIFSFIVKNILYGPQTKEEEKKKEEKTIEGMKKDTLSLIEQKLTKLGFEVHMRVVAIHPDELTAKDYVKRVNAALRQYAAANVNSFKAEFAEDTTKFLEHYRQRQFPATSKLILNTEELASIYHFPNETVETPAISWAPARHAEPPLNLPIRECTYFGKTTYRDKLITFGIRREDRRRHMYLIGKTGTGKTTVFKAMIKQDMDNGAGFAVIDPHGQLIDELLEMVPDHRLEDVVIFDPSDTTKPVALNLLEANTEDVGQKNLLASGLLMAFKKNFEYSWGPRLEYLLNNAILTLVGVDKTTLLGITRLLSDKNYRKYITYKVKDPILADFWDNEYTEFQQSRIATEAVAPIQNKVGRFLASSTIRNILGQAHSTIDFDDIMNSGKMLFITLSKGRIGEDNANLLGSLLVSRLNFSAMRRVDIPEEQRRDFNLYVDEFQNFASGDFASILSEARKYRLNLHLTHQYTKQLPEEILDAVVGNVGTLVALTLGAPDALALEKEFEPVFTANDLINLEKYQFYTKLMIDQTSSLPFSGITIPPQEFEVLTGNRDKAVQKSREKYGREREQVEEIIKRWRVRNFDLGMAKAEEIVANREGN